MSAATVAQSVLVQDLADRPLVATVIDAHSSSGGTALQGFARHPACGDGACRLLAASSLGKWRRVLMIFRMLRCRLSSALVVYMTRRTSGGNAKKGITWGHAARHTLTTIGNRWPQGPSANASKASAAAVALAAV